jgi:DNA-binding response OmpR family regulator
MSPRILSVGVDPRLLKTRQMLLASRGYDVSTATPSNVDDKLSGRTFDLVILSVMLGEQEQNRIIDRLPPETKSLPLRHFVRPEELFDMVAMAVGPRGVC